MTARSLTILDLSAFLQLDRGSGVALNRQLMKGLRDAILSGRLKPGTQLPSTRSFSTEFGISRNTVVVVFDQLISEGYLNARVGSGTSVREDLPEKLFQPSRSTANEEHLRQGARRSRRQTRSKDGLMNKYAERIRTVRPFNSGLPALDAFPYDLWKRMAKRAWRRLSAENFGYGDPGGYPPLREAIAEYLRVNRGVKCTADQVIVVSGSQQGLNLVAHALLQRGDDVWVEDPGYIAARAAFLNVGANCVPVRVDAEGLDVNRGTELAQRARLALVTPSHQMPLGMVMTLSRRLALLNWANNVGAWIVEDDYNSEFRYRGLPLPALQGLDTNQRVIYMGTFSKTLLPALRIGFLFVPADLVGLFLMTRTTMDFQPPLLEQAALSEFSTEGHFVRHVRRMRQLYECRQQILLSAVQAQLADFIEIAPADAGMHLIGWLAPGTDDKLAAEYALRHDCVIRPVSWFSLRQRLRPGLVLGYPAFKETELLSAVARLRQALTEFTQESSPRRLRSAHLIRSRKPGKRG